MLKITKHKANPLLGPNPKLVWGNEQARNPGVIFDGKKFRMTFTAGSDPYNNDGKLFLGYAESDDGINFKVNEEPFLSPSDNSADFDHGTVEDTRITELNGEYLIAYAGRSVDVKSFTQGKRNTEPKGNDGQVFPTWEQNFRRVGFAKTKDWKNIERLGPLTSAHLSDANVVLFPEKINNKYVFFHRPTVAVPWALLNYYHKPSIWLTFSNTLTNVWPDDRLNNRDFDYSKMPDDSLLIKPEYKWEESKIGGSGVPIPTDDGWLTIYHGVDLSGTYRVGLMLLDRENPRKVIARCPNPIMQPEENYELKGRYPKCIFPCANPIIDDKVYIYYGAVDLYTCLATVKLKDLPEHVLKYRIKK